jgi:arylsulfatase A-like enzyme
LKPNILFLVIDSLRADRIFGKEKNQNTPNIDALIKKGVYFSNAITTNPYTGQVMQSIFTSKLPLVDRITKKSHLKTNSKTNPLSLLKNAGYNIVTTTQEDVFLHGFDQKFDDKDIFDSEENLYNGLSERILKKLNSLNEPWFYYIHLEDLHLPCNVPEKLQHLRLLDRYKKNLCEIDLLVGEILKIVNLDETLIVITSDHGEYISSADGARGESKNTMVNIKNSIKKFIPKKTLAKIHLKKQSINREIHSLRNNMPHLKRNSGSTRMSLSNNLFDDIVHVPLIFAGNKINLISSITTQICNIDIFPTILDLVNISTTELDIHGRSLIPLLESKEFDSIPQYMTSLAVIPELFLNIDLSMDANYSLDPLVGIRTQDFKYFRNYADSKKNIHLYDLQNDPLEDDNISNKRPDLVKEMESHLQKFNNLGYFVIDKKDIDDKIDDDEIKRAKESLKKLGYI